MRPLLHPFLVNGRTGDPALYVETLFEKGAIMFDLGDISNLPPRKVQRLEHVFVSHAHIDHFIGFAGEETAHVNVWRNRLSELGLPVGPWLRALKRALLDERPDDYPIEVGAGSKEPNPRMAPLGALRATATVTPGQKIGYVTDA